MLTHSLLSGRGGSRSPPRSPSASRAVLLLGLRAPAMQLGGFSLSLVDVAAIGALVAIVLSFARGDANAGDLAGRSGTGAVLILLPALVAFVPPSSARARSRRRLRVLGRMGRARPCPRGSPRSRSRATRDGPRSR